MSKNELKLLTEFDSSLFSKSTLLLIVCGFWFLLLETQLYFEILFQTTPNLLLKQSWHFGQAPVHAQLPRFLGETSPDVSLPSLLFFVESSSCPSEFGPVRGWMVRQTLSHLMSSACRTGGSWGYTLLWLSSRYCAGTMATWLQRGLGKGLDLKAPGRMESTRWYSPANPSIFKGSRMKVPPKACNWEEGLETWTWTWLTYAQGPTTYLSKELVGCQKQSMRCC